ncbi:2, 3 -cyclic-nucleotide 3 -phosphodiesterase [Lecanosticta acicola]|uniref:2,3 -cyclic-nucleotide 3 -phosphodiesterase n=1 Tax=Lecanosticta acicola TaxID=111012 RepID=A0AAI8YRS0_9PEZI|nr:2, 3 -cyclic-nucleotide 3 -phosphodiesterase [Lecanosticta acicola]
MPGYSLWLVPRSDNPFNKTAQELISDTVPRNFVSPEKTNHFIPHVTLTSEIDPEKVLAGKSPQEWLDSLSMPEEFKCGLEVNEVLLQLDTVEAEEPFFRKMNIALKQNDNLSKLAALCRQKAVLLDADDAKAQTWVKSDYRPHLSLFYGDVPTREVQSKVPLVEMKIGFAFGDLFACCGGALCLGGEMVLVDTTKAINEWEIIARRETPWATWRATRNLL